MQTAEIALKPLPGTANHVLQERLDDVPAGSEYPMPLAVYQLLHSIRVAYPAFQVIEHTEAFINVAQVEQPVSLMAEGVADFTAVNADNRCHGGKDQGFGIVVLYI